MIHFLRDNKNKTIIETEIYKDEIGINVVSKVNVAVFGTKLTTMQLNNICEAMNFMNDIQKLNDVNQIIYHMMYENKAFKSKKEVDEFVKVLYKCVAESYNLKYITD